MSLRESDLRCLAYRIRPPMVYCSADEALRAELIRWQSSGAESEGCPRTSSHTSRSLTRACSRQIPTCLYPKMVESGDERTGFGPVAEAPRFATEAQAVMQLATDIWFSCFGRWSLGRSRRMTTLASDEKPVAIAVRSKWRPESGFEKRVSSRSGFSSLGGFRRASPSLDRRNASSPAKSPAKLGCWERRLVSKLSAS